MPATNAARATAKALKLCMVIDFSWCLVLVLGDFAGCRCKTAKSIRLVAEEDVGETCLNKGLVNFLFFIELEGQCIRIAADEVRPRGKHSPLILFFLSQI